MSLCWMLASTKTVPTPQSLAAEPTRVAHAPSRLEERPRARAARASVLALGVVASRAVTIKKVRSRSAMQARGGNAETTSGNVEGKIVEAVLRSSKPVFDPLGLSEDAETYQRSRDLEMITGRFAMLAAVGYPTAELFHEQIAEAAGMPAQLTATGQAPHVFNAGANPVLDAVVFVSLAGMLATMGEISTHRPNGNAKFDPMNPKEMRLNPMMSPTLRCLLREAQRVNGRAAMVAVIGMMAVEGYTGKAVVDVTPFMFGVQ